MYRLAPRLVMTCSLSAVVRGNSYPQPPLAPPTAVRDMTRPLLDHLPAEDHLILLSATTQILHVMLDTVSSSSHLSRVASS